MEKKRKSPHELLESLKAIRKRPVPLNKIEEHNRIIETDNEHEQQKKNDHLRKIARSPEADL